MKIYLVHGTHPVLPNEVEFAHGTLDAANAAALALVNSLREIPTDDDAVCLPPLVDASRWQLGLDEWQRAYLEGKLDFPMSRVAEMPDADVSIAMAEDEGGDVWIVEMDVDVPPVPGGGLSERERAFLRSSLSYLGFGDGRWMHPDTEAEQAPMTMGEYEALITKLADPETPVEPATPVEPSIPGVSVTLGEVRDVEPGSAMATVFDSFVEAGRAAERVDIGTRTTRPVQPPVRITREGADERLRVALQDVRLQAYHAAGLPPGHVVLPDGAWQHVLSLTVPNTEG